MHVMSLTNFTPGGSAMKSRLPWSAFPQLPEHPPPVAQDGSSSDVDVVSDEGTVTHNGLVIDPASAANTAAVPGAGADLDVGGCTDEEILFRSGFRTDGGLDKQMNSSCARANRTRPLEIVVLDGNAFYPQARRGQNGPRPWALRWRPQL